MKKRLLTVITIALSLVLLFTSAVTPATAAELQMSDATKLTIGKAIVKVFGAVSDVALKGVSMILPDPAWPDKADFKSENFLEGTGDFQTSAAAGAKWHAGFASESIIPEDLATEGYAMAGRFHITAEEVYDIAPDDDQRFRVIALNDGSGNGTALFCAIDAYGFTSGEVRKVRGKILAALAEKGVDDVKSISITSSHSHSVLDVHGLGAGVLDMMGESYKGAALRAIGRDYEVSSLDPKLMEVVYTKAVKAALKAYDAMTQTTGTLSFASFDAENLLHDKQLPVVFDKNINRIKFVPDAPGKREIWLVNLSCHPVKMMGASCVFADFPLAIAKWADELADADVAFYQGAELAISRDEGTLKFGENEELKGLEGVARSSLETSLYGKELVRRMLNEPAVESFNIEPYLNVRMKEQFFDVGNPLVFLISKLNMLNNVGVRKSFGVMSVQVLSEVGYCEFGSKLAIVMLPGEVDPEIVFGGTRKASEAWNGVDWAYRPFTEMVGSGRKLIAFGITNDQIGYVIPDNDFAHPFASLFEDLIGGGMDKHYEEMLSVGKTTASTLAQAFEDLVESTK